MEGVASEAASLAGHLGLGKLVYLYDDNQISIEGCTRAGLHRGRGGALRGLRVAGRQGGRRQRPEGHRHRPSPWRAPRRPSPRSSWCALVIGCGSPHKAGSAEAHGAPLGVDECRLTKEALGWPGDLFFAVPERVREQYAAVATAGGALARSLGGDVRALRAGVPRAGRTVEASHGGRAAGGVDGQAAGLRSRREPRHPGCLGQGPQRSGPAWCPR